MKAREIEEKGINIAAFFVYGFVNTSMEVLLFTMVQDFFLGTSLPSTILVLATYAPHFMCAAILPYFAGRIGQLAASVSMFVFFTAGLLLITLPAELGLRLTGAVCIGLGVGICTILVMGFTARYSDMTVHAFVSGTGLSSIVGNIFYTGMTTWLRVPPRRAAMMFLAVPPFVLLFYFLMEKRQPVRTTRKASDKNKIEYSALVSDDDDQAALTFTCRDKLLVIRDIKLLVAALFVGYVAKYLTMQSVVTTLAFPNAPFGPRDHFPYYVLVNMIADCIGRSYGLVVSLVKGSSTTLVTSHTWVITIVAITFQMILVLASWFRFLPNVYAALAIVFLFGLATGWLYCCSFVVASRGSCPLHVEYGRAFLIIAISAGIITAALLGLIVEPLLMQHCLHTFSHTEYCLTRSFLKVK